MGFNYARVLVDSAQTQSATTAAVCGRDEIDYATLDVETARCAAYFADLGLTPGDRVALMLPNGLDFVVAYWGSLRAGLVVVPINPLMKSRELGFFLRDSDAKMLLTTTEIARAEAATIGAVQCFAVDGPAPRFRDRFAGTAPQADVVHRASDDPAVLLYTSGTTGTPKGAVLSHANLAWNVHVVGSRYLKVGPDDVVLGGLPLFHVFGQVLAMGVALCFGARLVLLPRFEPESALDVMESQRATLVLGVPTMFNALLHAESAPRRDLGTLRMCMSGGAALAAEVLHRFEKRFGCEIVEGYGLSETSPTASINPPGLRKVGSVGTPIWGVQMRVVGTDGDPLPAGEVGEIQIRGHCVMTGYHNRPDATAAAVDAEGWFRTGDLAHVDDDGYFFIVDRLKDLIIRGGYNVYPRELEELLYEHPDVAEAAVLGVPDPHLGEEIVAVVAAKPGHAIDEAALREWAKERVAAYKYPRHVVAIPELPKGATGKILKRGIDVAALLSAR